MAVSRYTEMTQFLTSIDDGRDGKRSLKVTFRAFGNEEKTRTLDVPLQPDTEKLEPFNVDMHGSPTAAFKMPHEYNSWFTDCFGYEVVLVYLGDNKRRVLFQDMVPTRISATSLDNVSSRLGPDEGMDVTKFRPNIVVSGADEAWEEDYWRKVSVNGTELVMTHNCVRCASINIDYNTGKPGTGESGQALKKLQKDRRVDSGAKWSPVFGRYTFWNGKGHEQIFRVGDDVIVTDVNRERTAFSKPLRSSFVVYRIGQALDD
ncbi:hypothetical protein N0V90_002261 [Kalmusia sp. IMI 367209]|nr:hypothetical protein N0V90_002261 [Kalmusia sp. IMI 367209]